MALLLRELIARPQGVYLHGCTTVPDMIVARKKGHKAGYVGGYSFAAMMGWIDGGIYYGGEMLQHIQSFTDCPLIQIPILADADDCYGGVFNVRRVVTDLFTKSDVAAIHIEDQIHPKRCGHLKGKRVMPRKTALDKMRAAVATRNSIDRARFLVGRTDTVGAANGGGVEDAIDRACDWLDIGVDGVWAEFGTPDTPAVFEFPRGVLRRHPQAIIFINISTSFRNWRSSAITSRRILEAGYKAPFSTYPSLRASIHAVAETAEEFAEDYIEGIKKLEERTEGGLGEDVNGLLGLKYYQDFEREFDPDAAENQAKSEGF